MPNVNSLEYQRTLQKQEKAVELMDIWAAILDAAEAIKALGGSYPDEHIRKAQDALLRAGSSPPATSRTTSSKKSPP